MKKLFALMLAFITLLASNSCIKSSVVKHPTPPAPDSTTLLLTGQTWVYYEYFYNFDSANTSLVWKTNSTINTLNLALNQVKFNTDSTYTEIDQNGNTLSGTWSFLNGETQVKVVNSEGTFISTIEQLTGDRYEWWASSTDYYGIMVPKNMVIDTAGGRTALLTAHTWVYSEYFYNFGQTPTTLVWKPNKPDFTLNLSRNTAKFDSSGSYTETDQNGNVFNGTWQFLNNQTELQVINSEGTFTSTITLLDTARFEWSEAVTNHYGEEIPQ